MGVKTGSSSGARERTTLVCGVFTQLTVLACVALSLMLAGCSGPMSKALALEQRGDVTGASAIYLQVLKTEPDNREALEGAAVCLFQLKRYDEALAYEEHLARLDPTDAQIRVELGFNYLNHQNRPTDAVRVLSEAVKLDPSAKHLCFLAQAETAVGDTKSAEQNLRQAIAAEPSYAFSYGLLAELLRGEGRPDEAQKVLNQAASLGVAVTQTT